MASKNIVVEISPDISIFAINVTNAQVQVITLTKPNKLKEVSAAYKREDANKQTNKN